MISFKDLFKKKRKNYICNYIPNNGVITVDNERLGLTEMLTRHLYILSPSNVGGTGYMKVFAQLSSESAYSPHSTVSTAPLSAEVTILEYFLR